MIIYLDINPNISLYKGEYYVMGTKEVLKEVTEFKDDSLYGDKSKYLGKSKVVAENFTLPIKKEDGSYDAICYSKELFDNFYKIDFKVFYCPNYIENQLYIDRDTEVDLNSRRAIYYPFLGEL